MKIFIKTLFIALFFVSISLQAQQPYFQSTPSQARYIGIRSQNINFFSASQRNSQWCWAASIQMVLNYYGVDISQEQIVARTYGSDPYGNLPNWSGSFQAITVNLNNWGVDNSGRQYRVMASVNEGAPTPAILLKELSQGRPIIVGYRSGANSGHAVVITAAKFSPSKNGPFIHSVVVRDPWPSTQNIQARGRVEYKGNQIASVMQAYWYIRVQ